METMNIQSVAEKNIVSVVLADIQPSNYNPRKNFDVASLAELAESIRQQESSSLSGCAPLRRTALKSYSGNAGIVPRSWQDWKKFRQSF